MSSERHIAIGTRARTDGPPHTGQQLHALKMAPSSCATPPRLPQRPRDAPSPQPMSGATTARAANRRGARAGLRHGGRAGRERRAGARGRGAVAARGKPGAVPGRRSGAAIGSASAGRRNAAFGSTEIARSPAGGTGVTEPRVRRPSDAGGRSDSPGTRESPVAGSECRSPRSTARTACPGRTEPSTPPR